MNKPHNMSNYQLNFINFVIPILILYFTTNLLDFKNTIYRFFNRVFIIIENISRKLVERPNHVYLARLDAN